MKAATCSESNEFLGLWPWLVVPTLGVIEGSSGHHSGETLAIEIGDRAHEAIQRCIDSDVARTTNQLEEIGVTVFNRATFPPTGSSVEVVESR